MIQIRLMRHGWMFAYPVVWKAPNELPVAGRLELGPAGVTLVGGERRSTHRLEIAYDEIVGVSRADQRLGRLPALRLEGHAVGSFLIAAVSGVALNREILDELYAALAAAF